MSMFTCISVQTGKGDLACFLVCLQGGKLSVLTAAVDPRVVALCLLDPVDNTVYAPLGSGYPSGIDALKVLGNKQVILSKLYSRRLG